MVSLLGKISFYLFLITFIKDVPDGNNRKVADNVESDGDVYTVFLQRGTGRQIQ